MHCQTNPERTLGEILDTYLRHRQLKYKTKLSYQSSLRRCVGDWLYLPAAQITPEMVYTRHRELSLIGKAQADLCFRVVRALFKFAQAYYELPDGSPEITKDPTKKLSGLRAWNGSPRRQGRIAPADVQRWFAAVQTLPATQRDHIILLFFTGMRKREAGRLLWEDVDLDKGTLTIRDPKNKKDCVLPLSSYAWDMLRTRRQYSSERYVFPGAFADSPMSDYDRTYCKVVLDTGIVFTPHDLRRGFMSTAAELGIQVFSIKKMLNHSSSDVTYGYYVADIERLRAEVQKVNDELVRQIYGQLQAA